MIEKSDNPSRRFAFIDFEDHKFASSAVKHSNHELHNQKMIVRFAFQKDQNAKKIEGKKEETVQKETSLENLQEEAITENNNNEELAPAKMTQGQIPTGVEEELN